MHLCTPRDSTCKVHKAVWVKIKIICPWRQYDVVMFNEMEENEIIVCDGQSKRNFFHSMDSDRKETEQHSGRFSAGIGFDTADMKIVVILLLLP